MSGRRTNNDAPRRRSRAQSALVAAYRQGLGLAAVAVARSPAGLRITVLASDDGTQTAADATAAAAHWWCRRAGDAARVVVAARLQLRRRESCDEAARVTAAASPRSSGARSDALSLACASIVSAANELNVALYTDEEIFADAQRIIARVDEEIEALRRAGELRSVNSSYRTYRMAAAARGESVMRYAEWFGKYRETLARRLAEALRYA